MRVLARISTRFGGEELLARLTGAGDRALILCYHNIVENKARGELALHVPAATFYEQVEAVQTQRTIIPLTELLHRLRSGSSIAKTAVLSFDDAYRGVIRWAMPYLAARSIPATLFPVASMVDREQPFWWDQMAEAGGGTIARRNQILRTFTGGDPFQQQVAMGGLPAEYFPAGSLELNSLDPRLISLGVHTVRHPNLTTLPDHRIREELSSAADRMREFRIPFVPAVAYPFGRFNRRVEAVTRELGLAGLSLRAGTASRSALPTRLPRFFVSPGLKGARLKPFVVGIG